MAKNFLELKNKAQKNLRILDVLITVFSFGMAVKIYVDAGMSGWFWFWLIFGIISLILVIVNPVAKVEKKLINSIIKRK